MTALLAARLAPPATALYDAALFVRARLSVTLASAGAAADPRLLRTVSIEYFPEGVRLVATDGYVLLRAFVPNVDNDEFRVAPGIDVRPDATAVAIDEHGRGRGLAGHVLKLVRAVEKDGGEMPAVRHTLGVVEPDGSTLPGMDPEFVVLEHIDDEGESREQVRLRVFDGTYPDWRTAVTRFESRRTGAIALNPEIVGRLSKLGPIHDGRSLLWHFGGEGRMAMVEVAAATPAVHGLVMPCRWDFDADRPAAEPGSDE